MANVVDVDQQAQTLQADLIKAGELPANLPAEQAPYFAWEDLREALLARQPVWCWAAGQRRRPYPDGVPGARALALAHLFAHGERYGGQLKRVLDGCQEMREAGQRVVLVTRQAQRISELLADREVTAVPVPDVLEPPPPRSLTLVQGTLAEGWALRAAGDAASRGSLPASPAHRRRDLWLGAARARGARSGRRPVAPEAFFADVQPGSYVVHVEHGIGLFQGLIKMALDGGEREYLLVEYAAGDKLYVPVYQADRLSRYVGVGEDTPHVNRLGTAEWERVKATRQEGGRRDRRRSAGAVRRPRGGRGPRL